MTQSNRHRKGSPTPRLRATLRAAALAVACAAGGVAGEAVGQARIMTESSADPLSAAREAQQRELKIPNLGNSSTSLFSNEQEYALGQAWLRAFRSQVRTLNDPLLQDYLEDILFRLASHSELQDKRISLVIVQNPTINAFAVPGGVIGVHTGLLTYAETEDELATVLGHEIAHLSQRHFSRGVEQSRQNTPLMLAGMLAGLVIMATTGSDAGMAAISATQAAAMDSQLRFSRANEQEADRIGMQTMVAAGFDPHAAPAMFERMLRASRFMGGNRIPEFLRSHPLSENRISDTRTRAMQFPRRIREDNLQYQIMRTRVALNAAQTPEKAAQQFSAALRGDTRSPEATRYGLALALARSGRFDEARVQLIPLLEGSPREVAYLLADAEIHIAAGEADLAVAKLKNALRFAPGNHALTMGYAEALLKDNKAHLAEEVLLTQSKRKPQDPGLWYLLAETQGLSGNILGLHSARAEYFILNGIFGEAEKQLQYGLKLAGNNHFAAARLEQRMRDVAQLKERIPM